MTTDSLSATDLVPPSSLDAYKAQVKGLSKQWGDAIVGAHIGKSVESLVDSDYMRLHRNVDYQKLAQNYNTELSVNGGPAPQDIGDRKKFPPASSVGHGTEGPNGGLTGQDPKIQWVVVRIGGTECLRPAETADSKIDYKTDTIRLAWDRAGFQDVGVLLIQSRRSNEIRVCTFVRIGPQHAITAAHCVADLESRPYVKSLDYSSVGPYKALAMIPQLTDVRESPSNCFDKPDKCGHWVMKLLETPEFPPDANWPTDNVVPSQDIALLRLAFPVELNRFYSTVPTSSLHLGPVTIAGYGLQSAKASHLPGQLSVGWQTWEDRTWTTGLTWTALFDNGKYVPCAGDSGAPVFAGMYNGAQPSATKQFLKTVHALISTSNENESPAASEINRCKESSRGTAEPIATHVTWLCKKSEGQIYGCPK